MKDYVSFLLDLNICIQKSNTAEKKLFAVETIKYYQPIKPSIPTEFIFFWLTRLSPFVGPPIDPNCTKSKIFNENGNISKGVDIHSKVNRGNRINNEVSQVDRLSLTNLNQSEYESHYDYCNIHNVIDKKIPFIEKIQPKHFNPNHFKVNIIMIMLQIANVMQEIGLVIKNFD